MMDKKLKEEIIDEAKGLITGERSMAYGNYEQQTKAIAAMFNEAHSGVKAPILEGRHVSYILMCLKMRRMVTSTGYDSHTDLIGYAALDAEFFARPELKEGEAAPLYMGTMPPLPEEYSSRTSKFDGRNE